MARILVAASAKKHRVNATRIRAALRRAGMPLLVDGDRMYFVGIDDRGVELEMIVVPDPRNDDNVLVIHAMPTHYRRGSRRDNE